MKNNHNLKIIKPNRVREEKAREIYLFDTHVAGTSYIENIEEIVYNLNFDDKLTCIREEDNEYDLQAIKLITDNDEKIGYIPQADNVIFARLMDAGKKLCARVRSIKLKGKWYKIDIAIFLLDDKK